jgi:hypothetical protein
MIILNEQYFHTTTTTVTSFQAFEAVLLRIQFFWDFATSLGVFPSVLRLVSHLFFKGQWYSEECWERWICEIYMVIMTGDWLAGKVITDQSQTAQLL